jgi:hypothetical protein
MDANIPAVGYQPMSCVIDAAVQQQNVPSG